VRRRTAGTSEASSTPVGTTASPRNIKLEALSMLAIAAILIWVRFATGRWMMEILTASLPSLGLG
jgi:hypothetical protein